MMIAPVFFHLFATEPTMSVGLPRPALRLGELIGVVAFSPAPQALHIWPITSRFVHLLVRCNLNDPADEYSTTHMCRSAPGHLRDSSERTELCAEMCTSTIMVRHAHLRNRREGHHPKVNLRMYCMWYSVEHFFPCFPA